MDERVPLIVGVGDEGNGILGHSRIDGATHVRMRGGTGHWGQVTPPAWEQDAQPVVDDGSGHGKQDTQRSMISLFDLPVTSENVLLVVPTDDSISARAGGEGRR